MSWTPKTRLTEDSFGTWFDPALKLDGSNADQLLIDVRAALENQRLEHALVTGVRPRRRSIEKQMKFDRRLSCILANGLRSKFFRERPLIAYFRQKDIYRKGHNWLSGATLADTVDEFRAISLLECTNGFWGGPKSVGGGPYRSPRGRTSTYRFTPALDSLTEKHAITEQNFIQEAPSRELLVRLRDSKDAERGLDFDPTLETEGWADSLENYNHFIDQHEIWLPLSIQALKRAVNNSQSDRPSRSRQPLLVQPETFRRYLYRVFNDGTFDHGGRLYGGWWQHLSGWARERLLIDDQNVIELDYSGMSVRMLYHLQGLDYTDDPYSLRPLSKLALRQGYKADHYRESIKKLVQAILNDENEDGCPEMIRLDQSFAPHFTRSQVRAEIEAMHSPILSDLSPGIGKQLQRLDSDVAYAVVIGLMDQGILALPIHDSFIVQRQHETALRNTMKTLYEAKFGHSPIIHTKTTKRASTACS